MADGETIYQAAIHGSHHHANCRECGDVIDIPNEYFSDLQQRRDSDHGFLAELDHISISGLCERRRE